ncbi:putative anthocyanidin reductase isoform X2 [Ziziphus jujuba]|uniref:Anthocyanidin reductase isoform X2 n=1 Tax=Ziziphus jujuba TaxID=326968 RepID=A0A6P4B7A4_ZIZJJ|nr:putative anthocyanidin reductase isoform X2 [Ziziphus jujuba]
MEELESSKGGPKTYCVTGASGYIGSCLVNTLLQTGHMVHATVRDPAKCLHLFSIWTGTDRLRLFQADLREEGSFNEAVKGCDGVFHLAASMEFNVAVEDNVESYVQTNIINPAIEGTLNLLKSCSKSRSVKRVVFTSSISTLTAIDSNGKWKPVVDETCQTPLGHVWDAKASGWVYVLSKLLTEEAAFRFVVENGIDLVSVITTTVAGPFITSHVPSSIQVLLSPITGDPELLRILSAVNARMGSIALVHIEDICNAHLLLMEHAKAKGRYICCAQSCSLSKLIDHLAQVYPCSNLQGCRFSEDDHDKVPSEISSKKLTDLGFRYKHGIQDIIHQAITYSLSYGFLPPIGNQINR